MGEYVSHVDFLAAFQMLSGAFIRVSLGLYLLGDMLKGHKSRSREKHIIAVFSMFLGLIALLPLSDIWIRTMIGKYFYPVTFLGSMFILSVLFVISRLPVKKGLGQHMNMMKIDHLLAKGNLSCAELIKFLQTYSDIEFIPNEKDSSLQAFYCRGMLDCSQLNKYYNRILLSIKNKEPRRLSEELPPVCHIKSVKEMFYFLFSGSLIIFQEGTPFFYVFNISKVPQRVPQESNTEVSIKGPKDSFIEEMDVNISLIRKRLKSEQLYCETFTLGTLSDTKVSLLYLHDKANPSIIQEIRKRLVDFQGEGVVSSGQLEQWLSDRSFSLFPLVDYATRPDYVIESMMKGRFILIINGSPFCINWTCLYF